MDEQKICRRSYRFYGQVQGVGFRYRAQCTAELYGLTGWVENLPDGSVAMEMQGLADALDRVPETICRGSSWIVIEHMDTKEISVLAKEYGFSAKGW
ncbi:MAG: acylphosphatase [Faecalibacterium sp.]|jgi:acylphosphatase|nr:acylphosphatase [Faecalibacterium sp.]